MPYKRFALLAALGTACTLTPAAQAQLCEPVVLYEDSVSHSAFNSKRFGDYVVCCGFGGITVYDVSDPTNTQFVSSTGSASGALLDFVMDGSLAFIADQVSGLVVYDLANPAAPAFVSATPVAQGRFGWSIAKDGDRVFMGWGNLIRVFDASDPAHPVPIGQATQSPNPFRMIVVGDSLHVLNIDGQYDIYDIAGSNQIQFVRSISILGQGQDIAYHNGTIYTANSSSVKAIRSFDASDPFDPVQIGYLETPASYAMGFRNDRLYAAGFRAFNVIDIHDPSSLSIVGSIPIAPDSRGVVPVGDAVFVSSFDFGSSLIDVETCDCPADTNHDGVVSPADFTAWISAYLQGSDECDQNFDGVCDPTDFDGLLANFTSGCG